MNVTKKDETVRAIALVVSDNHESVKNSNIKDVFTDGDSIARLYRRFDPGLTHLKNPKKAEVDDAFKKLNDRLASDTTAMVLFAYSGHAMDEKGKVIGILEGDAKTGLYPFEDRLTALGKSTNVHAFFNSNRVYANYSEQLM